MDARAPACGDRGVDGRHGPVDRAGRSGDDGGATGCGQPRRRPVVRASAGGSLHASGPPRPRRGGTSRYVVQWCAHPVGRQQETRSTGCCNVVPCHGSAVPNVPWDAKNRRDRDLSRRRLPWGGAAAAPMPGSAEARPALVGVDQLADGGDLAAQLVVDGDLAGDLVAGVEDGGVVAPAELGADAQRARRRSPRASGTSRSGAASRSPCRASGPGARPSGRCSSPTRPWRSAPA